MPLLSPARHQGRDVVELEELWGDYLVSRKSPDAAIAHYSEAFAYVKAIEAAISCRQWAKAAQIVETQQPEEAKPYYQQIAKHYESARSYDEAERFYLRAGNPQDVVEMYSKVNKWEKAHRVATEHMTQAEVAMLYITQARATAAAAAAGGALHRATTRPPPPQRQRRLCAAQAHRLESTGKFKEAERLYVMVNEPDLAINMYKKNRRRADPPSPPLVRRDCRPCAGDRLPRLASPPFVTIATWQV